MERHRRTIEKLRGVGTILDQHQEIAKVKYELDVTQAFIVARTIDGSAEKLPGLGDTRGVLTLVDGESNLIEKDGLILRLSDGRQWSFFVRRGNPFSRRCVVVSERGWISSPDQ